MTPPAPAHICDHLEAGDVGAARPHNAPYGGLWDLDAHGDLQAAQTVASAYGCMRSRLHRPRVRRLRRGGASDARPGLSTYPPRTRHGLPWRLACATGRAYIHGEAEGKGCGGEACSCSKQPQAAAGAV